MMLVNFVQFFKQVIFKNVFFSSLLLLVGP